MRFNSEKAARILIPVLALLMISPFFTPPVGLLIGTILGLTLGNPYAVATKNYSRLILSWSIIGIGASMNLYVIAQVGIQGLGYTFAGISLAFIAGLLGGRILKVNRNIVLLLCSGTAICGGSAIAAVSPVIKAKDHEISVALATVFLLNAVALFVFPMLGHALGLDETQFGLWSALAIHDTSSVVGAASKYGSRALEIATTVKLARALWIFPMAIIIGYAVSDVTSAEGKKDFKKARPPFFIYGFILAAALVTFIPALKPGGALATQVAKQALVLTLFLIGCGLTRASVKAAGPKALILGVLLWFIVSASTLAAIFLGFVRFT